MSPVDLGQTYRYRHFVKNASGVLANAGTVTVTITLPDGTTSTPAVVNTSTGVYDIAYTTSQAGLHDVKGTVTGGVLGSEVDSWEDAFTVETGGRMLIGVDEASSRLRAAGIITSDADREQLRWYCMVASSAVERDLSRVLMRRSIVATYNGGDHAIRLYNLPVISITSVTEDGATVAGTSYVLDPANGLLYRGGASSPQTWAWGRQNIVVTYVAGYLDPPREVREVALSAVQEMWQSSQQAEHPLLEETVVGAVQLSAARLDESLRGAYNKLRIKGLA